jgi:hypothetical protein
MYLILLGCALVNENKYLYERVVAKLEVTDYPQKYTAARIRTDRTIRRLLNLIIQASVIVYDVNLCEKTLIYGRKNTFLLSVTDNLL